MMGNFKLHTQADAGPTIGPAMHIPDEGKVQFFNVHVALSRRHAYGELQKLTANFKYQEKQLYSEQRQYSKQKSQFRQHNEE
jgi:hypothetical protein